MLTRRRLLAGGLAGCVTSELARASAAGRPRDQHACREEFANPPWKPLSSAKGELPQPETSAEQTGAVVGDIDGDGRVDFAITSRGRGNAAVWMQNTLQGWKQHVIDPGPLSIEAGGSLLDVDGDGRLDLVAGGDHSSNEVWWWQNPYPHYERPWTRRIIKHSGKTQHHDLIAGDVLGEGRPQVIFWNQGAAALYLARIPGSPRMQTAPWDCRIIFQGNEAMEGLALGDIDGDGKKEIVGGGRWFKHEDGLKFAVHVIDEAQQFSRAAAGRLVRGSAGEQAVFANGDGCGPLKWYERDPSDSWTGHDLLGEDLVHAHSLHLGDVDGDGNLDIFVAEMAKWCDWTRTVDYPRAHLWILYGDGKGHFEKVTIAEGGNGSHEAQLADFRGTGRLDILGKPYMSGAPGVEMWHNPGRL